MSDVLNTAARVEGLATRAVTASGMVAEMTGLAAAVPGIVREASHNSRSPHWQKLARLAEKMPAVADAATAPVSEREGVMDQTAKIAPTLADKQEPVRLVASKPVNPSGRGSRPGGPSNG
jgi:hypothetical protein